MSIKVSTWVWKHAKHRGTQKLLLLALADFANDSGVCWPSVGSLSDRIGEGERHVHRLIKELVASGDLLVVPGGGRGKTTRYGIAVGLNARQREKLNTVLQNSVSQNTVLENTDMETVTSEAGNSDIWGTETVTSEAEAEELNSAPEPAITARQVGGIHHGSVIDPSDPQIATQSGRGKKAKAPTEPTEHQALMAAYAEWLGYKIPYGGKEAAAAKRLLGAGYSVAQIEQAYYELKSRPFYGSKHLSLQAVFEQIGALLNRNKPNRNGAVNGFVPHVAPVDKPGEYATREQLDALKRGGVA
jgi:hypothetical protein